MRFKYETAVITLVQFIVLSLLGIANGLNSIVSTCHTDHGDCISNTIVSLIFFLLTCAWFAFIWVLGYTAQERRSKRIAQLLICAEGLIALVALFNAKHHTDLLGLSTSVIDLVLAVWIITLAWRLMRSGGGRIVSKQRAGNGRARRRPTARQ
ncbi:MAG TPA: hypothetical protein VF401_01195 [Candidatus Saccharimonadales bacterium]